MHGQAQLATLQDEIAAQQAELERIADREERLATEARVAQRAMGTQRWADRNEDDEEEQR